MIVRGKNVTVSQAREVLRRTDDIFNGSYILSPSFSREVADRLRFCKIQRMWMLLEEKTWLPGEMGREFGVLKDWHNAWGFVETRYVRNYCLGQAYPHAWISTDGSVYSNGNIGKYPSGQEVFEDWQKIADAFPFLELTATLCNNENDDLKPVVTFLVSGGSVECVEPHPLPAFPQYSHEEPTKENAEETMNRERLMESTFPDGWLEEWEQIAKERFEK